MASSTAYELGKSSWPSQILLVCRLGTGSASSETQTLTRSKPHPYGIEIRLNTPTRGSSRSTVLTTGLYRRTLDRVCLLPYHLQTGSKLRVDLSLGRWIYIWYLGNTQDQPFSSSAAASVYIWREAWETAEERQWRLQDLSLQCLSNS